MTASRVPVCLRRRKETNLGPNFSVWNNTESHESSVLQPEEVPMEHTHSMQSNLLETATSQR